MLDILKEVIAALRCKHDNEFIESVNKKGYTLYIYRCTLCGKRTTKRFY